MVYNLLIHLSMAMGTYICYLCRFMYLGGNHAIQKLSHSVDLAIWGPFHFWVFLGVSISRTKKTCRETGISCLSQEMLTKWAVSSFLLLLLLLLYVHNGYMVHLNFYGDDPNVHPILDRHVFHTLYNQRVTRHGGNHWGFCFMCWFVLQWGHCVWQLWSIMPLLGYV